MDWKDVTWRSVSKSLLVECNEMCYIPSEATHVLHMHNMTLSRMDFEGLFSRSEIEAVLL